MIYVIGPLTFGNRAQNVSPREARYGRSIESEYTGLKTRTEVVATRIPDMNVSKIAWRRCTECM